MKKPILIATLSAFVLAGAGYAYIHRNEVSTDDAAFAGRTVTLAPKVAGYVKALNIDDNQAVKAGDVLLEIDDADYIVRRDRAKATLEAAQAAAIAGVSSAETTHISAPSSLEAATAQVSAAQAQWEKAANDLKRMQKLSNDARSVEQLDQAIAAEKATKGALDDAQARMRSAETAPKAIEQAVANSEKLQAQVKEAEANLAQAEIDLANTKIIAPMDGRITKRSVERGNYVQPGQALSVVVGTEIWVVANFKETQLKSMHVGQPVSIAVDAYPNVTLTGKVESIQSGSGAFFSTFPPENATGNFVKVVQRVPVKITLDSAPEAKLAIGPGMSVVPTVNTAE